MLFLVLTTHTDSETHWETHTDTDVDKQWCLHLCVCKQTCNTRKYTHNMQNTDVNLCAQTEMEREAAKYVVSIYLHYV